MGVEFRQFDQDPTTNEAIQRSGKIRSGEVVNLQIGEIELSLVGTPYGGKIETKTNHLDFKTKGGVEIGPNTIILSGDDAWVSINERKQRGLILSPYFVVSTSLDE